jgi:PKD repeat protein
MFDLKARTSFTQSNLVYLAPTTVVGGGLSNFWEADGTGAEYTTDLLNLTRDSSITPNDQYGLAPISNIPAGTGTANQSFSFTVNRGSPTQFINDIQLTFRDIGTTNNINYPLSSVFLNRIHVEVPDSFGGWVRIGYFKLNSGRVDESQPAGQITQAVKTMTPVRPMPMNIPYFKYTNAVVLQPITFQSMETGTSYAWSFGDGGTSTLQNPVYTYSTAGTKTVSLTVTFAGGGTRTTTEPVIVEAASTAKRWLRIEQQYFDGASRFSTPTLANFSIWNGSTKLTGNNPTWGFSNNAYINDGSGWYSGLTSTPPNIAYALLNANPALQTQLVTGTGVRVSGDDSFYRSQWSGVADMFGLFDNITDVKVDAAAIVTNNSVLGGGTPPLSGPTYNIYTVNYQGDDFYAARQSSSTLIGTITPTNMSRTALTTYTMTPV